MNDLTLIYYTDNALNEAVARRIREYALEVTKNKYPVVSVSQKPIKFGENICLGEIGKSKYNLWKQVWIAAKAAKTKYVACIEDDTLYSSDHFLYRPPDDAIAYETNYWFMFPGKRDYYWRVRNGHKLGGQFGCISNRKLLVNNLTRRYEMYKTDPYLVPDYLATPYNKRAHFGEPARGRDHQFGIKNSKNISFSSKKPCVVFIHDVSLGLRGFTKHWLKKYGYPSREDTTVYLKQFDTPTHVFSKFWGKK